MALHHSTREHATAGSSGSNGCLIDATADLDRLPSPPFVAMEIIRMMDDPASSAADLAAVVGQDPVLATRLLQVANSAAYGLTRDVTTIERATALLGLKAVKLMALSFSLAADIAESDHAGSEEAFWYHSLFNAVTARRWAELMAPGLVEEAFLTGLLSHFGRLVLAQNHPREFRALLAAHDTNWPSFAAERRAFGYTSCDVTVALLEKWGLPPLIAGGPGIMYGGCEPDPEVRGAAELARVLDMVVVTEHALRRAGRTSAMRRLAAALRDRELAEDEIENFVDDLQHRIRGVADLLDVRIPRAVSHDELLARARTLLVEVSLAAVHDLQEVEARAEELRQSNEALEGLVFEDRLTGVANRAAIDDHLHRAVARAQRADPATLGVLLFDIDHFKRVNDSHGHHVGDQVLREVAQAMRDAVRADEMFGRYGGEEFALVAVDCSPEGLVIAGERLRSAVEDVRVWVGDAVLTVTISGGAAHASRVPNPTVGDELLRAADQALYEAKASGRNQIRLASS